MPANFFHNVTDMTHDDVDPNVAKRNAALAAIALLPPAPADGPVVTLGLGTGSTAKLFVEELAQLVARGARYRGVPTSQSTRAQAESLGVPLVADTDAEPWDIALCVDGADEVDPRLNVIKGGGGALTREKIVNFAARQNILIVDESKLSAQLGDKWHVPIEVLRFGHHETARRLGALGRPTLRRNKSDGAPFLTDAGNYIYDVALGPLPDPAHTDALLGAITGVVETGLFVGRADLVIVAGAHGTRTLVRP